MATSMGRRICSASFSRLPSLYLQSVRGFFTQNGGLLFRATQPMCAEPPKKKKRADPKMEQMRQQRLLKRMKKVQFKMGDPELKPVEEFRTDRKLLLDDKRKRELPDISYDEQERRALLQKRWARYRFQEHVKETHLIKDILRVQQKALQELRAESEDLYLAAVERDTNLFPFEVNGPVHTPPIPGYSKDSPDGEYVDVTKQYK
ncbi:large ribosomal subunit protein mL40-like [Asterias amurensis]|uniref:large ribosomal subunit protein mL40-like n=1 Tax=Asterias amurensis TaxID=7602 RepID=UPI003AB45943